MTDKRKTVALWIFTLGVFMSALDNGIISAALTTINSSFDVTEIQGAWGITLYTLGMAITTPIVGKLADRYGRKKLFLVEISIFALGSLLVALSPSFIWFLAARIVQSIGGGGIFIIASSFVLTVYPKEKQGRLLGMLGAVNGIASVVGPNIGSLILNATNQWHWLFTINLPIAILLVIFGIKWIDETKNPETKPLDLLGSILLSFAIFSLMYALTNLEGAHLLTSLATPSVFLWLALSFLTFALLVKLEKSNQTKDVDSILNYDLLANKQFLLTLLMGLLSGMLIAIFVYIPSYVEHHLGVPANQAGVWMSGIGLASIVGAGMGGMLVDKLGAVKTVVVASLLSSLGFFSLAFFSHSLGWFLVCSSVTGLGFGMLMGAPLSVLASKAAGKEKGSALGMLSVSRQVGLTIAPIVYASLIQTGFNQLPSKLLQVSDTSAVQQVLENNTTENMLLALLKLPDASLKESLMTVFKEVAGQAYGHMFILSGCISVVILLAAFSLGKKKQVTR